MARNIKDRPNAVPVDGNNPYGRVKDETSLNAGDGTPVNDASVGDVLVAIQKIMDDQGISPNELPENVSNGFQIVEAFNAIPPPDDSVSTNKIQDDAVTTNKIADDSVSTDKIQDDAITDSKIPQTANILRTGSLAFGSTLKASVIEIGAWNMEVSQGGDLFKVVPHGISSLNSKFVFGGASIKIDTGVNTYILSNYNVSSNLNGLEIDDTNVTLYNQNGSLFDAIQFSNDAMNRGHIFILYIE